MRRPGSSFRASRRQPACGRARSGQIALVGARRGGRRLRDRARPRRGRAVGAARDRRARSSAGPPLTLHRYERRAGHEVHYRSPPPHRSRTSTSRDPSRHGDPGVCRAAGVESPRCRRRDRSGRPAVAADDRLRAPEPGRGRIGPEVDPSAPSSPRPCAWPTTSSASRPCAPTPSSGTTWGRTERWTAGR